MDIGNTVTDVEQRLEKVCLPIFKRYALGEENALKLTHELARVLLLARDEESATFETLATEASVAVEPMVALGKSVDEYLNLLN